MYYLAFLQNTYAHPNKLSEAIHSYLSSINRTLVPADQLELFKKEVTDTITDICSKHSRCKPMTATWSSLGLKSERLKDFSLSFINHTVCTFKLYQTNDTPKITTNEDVLERISQLPGTYINRLFWLAGSNEYTDELSDVFETISEKSFKACFPNISEEILEKRTEVILTELYNNNYNGFLAEILVPKTENFTFKNGIVKSYTVRTGHSTIMYCYAETPEDLLMAIEKISEQLLKESWEKELNKKSDK